MTNPKLLPRSAHATFAAFVTDCPDARPWEIEQVAETIIAHYQGDDVPPHSLPMLRS